MTIDAPDRRGPDLLPHRPPFRFVDEVVSVDPARAATALWTPARHCFDGHFPANPVLPGVLQIEALAQTGALAVLSHERFAGRLPLFGGVDKARFRRVVSPGETLTLSVELERLAGRGGRGRGVATVDGHRCCEASLLFVMADLGAEP